MERDRGMERARMRHGDTGNGCLGGKMEVLGVGVPAPFGACPPAFPGARVSNDLPGRMAKCLRACARDAEA